MSIKQNKQARIAGGVAAGALLLAVGAGIGSTDSTAEPAGAVTPTTRTVTETITPTAKARPATVTKTKTVTKTRIKTRTVTKAPAEPLYEEPQTDAYYENCDAARAAGAAPVTAGDPGYGSHLDRDGDGVGCE